MVETVFSYDDGCGYPEDWVLTATWDFVRYNSGDAIDESFPMIVADMDKDGSLNLIQLFNSHGNIVDVTSRRSVSQAIKILIMDNPSVFGKETVVRVVEKKMQILDSVSKKCVILVDNTNGTGGIESENICLYGTDTFEGHFLRKALEEVCTPFFIVEGTYHDKKFHGNCSIKVKNIGTETKTIFNISAVSVIPTIQDIWETYQAKKVFKRM